MVRVGAKVLLLVLLVSWLAPAAVATYAQPDHACCRRGGHHCDTGAEPAFRSAKVHCRSCQAVLTPHQTPRPAENPTVIAAQDEHPFIREFFPVSDTQDSLEENSQRGPPPSHR